MPIFKGTMIFSGPQHGWTESWWNNWPNTSYGAIGDRLKQLANSRANLLGRQTKVIGIRVSQETLKNDGFSEYVDIAMGGPTQGCDSDEPDACVVSHAYDDNYQRKKAVYLRGIPDDIDIQFGKLVEDNCDWGKAFKKYANLLWTDGWGWMGRPLTGPLKFNVTGYVTNPDNRVTVTFDGALFAGVPVGTKVTVTISGINKPEKSALTGQIIMLVNGNTQCTTVDPIALFAYNSGGHGLFAPAVFIPMKFMNLSRIGTRRVGTPLLASRGRGRARAKG